MTVNITNPNLKLTYIVFPQNMIDVSLVTPIQDGSVYRFPLNLVSDLLQEVSALVIFTPPNRGQISDINILYNAV